MIGPQKRILWTSHTKQIKQVKRFLSLFVATSFFFSAVYLEMGNFEACLAECQNALDRRYEVKADYEKVVKVGFEWKRNAINFCSYFRF